MDKIKYNEDIEASRDALSNSINNLGSSLNAISDLANDIILKFNVIPNALITGFLLSTDFRDMLSCHSMVRGWYIASIATFLGLLIIVSLYTLIYEWYYSSKYEKSNKLLEADEIHKYEVREEYGFIKEANKTIEVNNNFPCIFKLMSKIRSGVLVINLVCFSVFILVGAIVMTDSKQNFNCKKIEASGFARDQRPPVAKAPRTPAPSGTSKAPTPK